jgi:hypothetical protein
MTWIGAATSPSASFYPTMGTVTAMIESGEFRLIRDDSLRKKLLQYHGSVTSALRIVHAVDPQMWRTIERLGQLLGWPALLEPGEAHRFTLESLMAELDRAPDEPRDTALQRDSDSSGQ